MTLEPLEAAHAAELFPAAAEDRSSYGYTLVPDSLEAMQHYVAQALEDERSGWSLPFAIRWNGDDRVIGTSRFLDLGYWDGGAQPWPPGRPSTGGTGVPTVAEIGSTWLAASAQRTGANSEAKLLMLAHAFETWRARRVSLKTDARNRPSRAAIERLGARFEGIRRVHLPATDGSDRDTAYYSILASEWPEVRGRLVERLAANARAGAP